MSLSFFLPLLTYPDPTPAAGLAAAARFAASIGGTLRVSSNVVDIPLITNPLALAVIDYSSIAAATESSSSHAADFLSAEARRHAEALNLTIFTDSFRTRPEALGDYLATAGRAHDAALLVINPDSDGHRAAAEALLFGSGGPVVLFPTTVDQVKLQSAAIAWDGGRAAARAVRDALPILRIVKRVTVLTSNEDKSISQASVVRVVEYLEDHDIETGHREVSLVQSGIGDAIQDAALKSDADFLVMGAYGHNRVREFVLGGATRSVLARPGLPTLMSH